MPSLLPVYKLLVLEEPSTSTFMSSAQSILVGGPEIQPAKPVGNFFVFRSSFRNIGDY